MKYTLFILMLFGLFSCKKEDVESEPIEGLQVITSLNQINAELESGVSMVFFHASWCSVCQAQRPAVSEVALDAELSEVFFGEVEYEDHPDIVEAHNIEGFPTIIIYNDGEEAQRFTGGGNTTADIKSAIQSVL